jgi:hypothetical protein
MTTSGVTGTGLDCLDFLGSTAVLELVEGFSGGVEVCFGFEDFTD